jgi:hypothetical protein
MEQTKWMTALAAAIEATKVQFFWRVNYEDLNFAKEESGLRVMLGHGSMTFVFKGMGREREGRGPEQTRERRGRRERHTWKLRREEEGGEGKSREGGEKMKRRRGRHGKRRER